MANSPGNINSTDQREEPQRPAKTSSNDPREAGTKKPGHGAGERAPDDQGNAITDQEVNENVAERVREQQEQKK